MIHFLIGFYFGGALATLLGFIAAGMQYSWAADKMASEPLKVVFLLLFWPYTLPKAVFNIMR
jgi:hypothetical protein